MKATQPNLVADSNRGRIAKAYSSAAETYDASNGLVLRLGSELIDLLRDDLGSPRRIMDVGCGTGTLSQKLATAFPRAEVVGCDIATGMVDHARRRCKANNLRFENGGLECLGGHPHGADLIFSNAVLHWLSDLGLAFSSFATALSPKGTLAFTAYLEGSYAEIDERVRGLFPNYRGVVGFPSNNLIVGALSTAGFQTTTIVEEETKEAFDSMEDFLRTKKRRGAPMVRLPSAMELSHANRRWLRSHLGFLGREGFSITHRIGTYLAHRHD